MLMKEYKRAILDSEDSSRLRASSALALLPLLAYNYF